jgi:gp16 family phage-associated protein
MHLKTAEEVKQEFIQQGIPVSSWAESKGFTPQEVYKVLNGQSKGNFGRTSSAVFRCIFSFPCVAKVALSRTYSTTLVTI